MIPYDGLERLKGVDVRLSAIMIRAAILFFAESGGRSKVRFTEGLRTRERQEALLRQKKTWTRQSKHLTGHAVDVAIFYDGDLDWSLDLYSKYAQHVQLAAEEFSQVVEWGGDWKQRDGVHFQLIILRAVN